MKTQTFTKFLFPWKRGYLFGDEIREGMMARWVHKANDCLFWFESGVIGRQKGQYSLGYSERGLCPNCKRKNAKFEVC